MELHMQALSAPTHKGPSTIFSLPDSPLMHPAVLQLNFAKLNPCVELAELLNEPSKTWARQKSCLAQGCYSFTLTVFVSGLTVNFITRSSVVPPVVGNADEPPLVEPAGPMPAGKYCLLAMLTCVGPLMNPTTRYR